MSGDDHDRSPSARGERVFLDAVLRPYRSLSRPGFAIMMVCVAGGGGLIGVTFLLAGAWPVTGFCGLEILLIYVFFRLNYRDGRAYETVRLTDRALTVRRVAPNGRAETWRLPPFWLRVSMDDPPGQFSQISLATHGRSLRIGAFLTPHERLDLARAIRAALNEYRQAPHPCGAA
jgi:uncharacterized membrane protein